MNYQQWADADATRRKGVTAAQWAAFAKAMGPCRGERSSMTVVDDPVPANNDPVAVAIRDALPRSWRAPLQSVGRGLRVRDTAPVVRVVEGQLFRSPWKDRRVARSQP